MVLSNPSSTNITVQVRDNNNTAIGEQTQQHYYKQHVDGSTLTGGDVDYISGPYYATFHAGVTSVTFYISIINDNIHEGNEYFTLTIVTTSIPSRVRCGYSCMTAVTIADTSGKFLIIFILLSIQKLSMLSFLAT